MADPRWLAASLLVLAACSSALPTPKTGPHAGEQPEPVPFPPPPAHVEVIPPRTQPKAVWVDGEWRWMARRWVWQPGAWEVPQPHTYYAPPVTVRQGDGSLAHFSGQWKPDDPNK